MKETIEIILPLTADFEGFSPKVYKCPAGFLTIGYGRNIEANPLTETEKKLLRAEGLINEKIAKDWLRENLQKCYEELAQNFNWFAKTDRVRKAALVDFDYNVGLGTLKTFKNTLLFLEQEDYKRAAENMRLSKWFKQVKRRGVRICNMIESGNI
ncbi:MULTISPECIES: glycoside hydrolase family protein [Helicobacter]|uniref:Lysozyme n=1 Tax=Helicobacter apodemus TaxID=135569 RepID=A0A4U8UD74_9HELI|nr:glycoside hydrolase family protein [Helicobacter apodemus]TLE14461.1 lysozyme [Helicobacter apodemus]